MTRRQIIERIERLLRVIADDEQMPRNTLQSVAQLAPTARSFYHRMHQAVSFSDYRSRDSLMTTMHELAGEISGIMKRRQPKTVFLWLDNVQRELEEFSQAVPREDIHEAIVVIAKFEQAYETYFESPRAEPALALTLAARALEDAFQVLEASLRAIRQMLVAQDVVSPQHRILEIYFPGELSVPETAAKLTSLNDIYQRFAVLAAVDISAKPLRIRLLDSGSLWVKIVGDLRIVALMEGAIKSVAGIVYRKYTNEGKVSTVGPKADAIREVLRLIKDLEKHGIDSQRAKYNVEEAAVKLSQEIVELLSGGVSVEVNGEPFGVRTEDLKSLPSQVLKGYLPLPTDLEDPNDVDGSATPSDGSSPNDN